MAKIKVLPDEVANRIAAGEIIERPYSVVKECVENSIDAGATEIIVKIVNGGRDLIQIIDNGCGMTEDDAFLSFERHATSKIRSADDIVHITTMGFRGEAVPSIASVSQFQMITKVAEEPMATQINFAGGKLENVQKTAAKDGTTITVRNLFYNVPARRKFLKTEPVEYKHILNYLHYQSVLFPQISFIFYSNHKEKFNYPATDSIEKRMLDVFGTGFTQQNYVYLSAPPTPSGATNTAPPTSVGGGRGGAHTSVIRMSGYLQDIEQTTQANLLDTHYIFVNRRYINDKSVYSAIRAAYEPFLKKYRFFGDGKMPNYIIFIDINPEEIDVNVHPAKTEIRFKNSNAVYQFVKESVYNCLHNRELQRYENTRVKLANLHSTAPLTPAEELIARELLTVEPAFEGRGSIFGVRCLEEEDSSQSRENQANRGSINTEFISPHRDTEYTEALRRRDDGSDKVTDKITIKDIEKSLGEINAPLQPPPPTPPRFNGEGESEHRTPNTEHRQSTWQTINTPKAQTARFQNEQYMILKTMQEDFVQMWQLHNTYICIQIDDGFVMIDQHAAHERILYEKLLKNIDSKKPNKQKLVFPLVIDLPVVFAETINDMIAQNKETLEALGFTIKSFSGNSIVIDEIPTELGYWDGGNIFIEILEQLSDELTQTKDFRIASAASVACKAAIKAGKKLTKKEMYELITELFTCEFPFQCPHGRPLIIKMTLTEIERMFKRII